MRMRVWTVKLLIWSHISNRWATTRWYIICLGNHARRFTFGTVGSRGVFSNLCFSLTVATCRGLVIAQLGLQVQVGWSQVLKLKGMLFPRRKGRLIVPLDLFHYLLAAHCGRHLVVYLDLGKWKAHALLSRWRSFGCLCDSIQITGQDGLPESRGRTIVISWKTLSINFFVIQFAGHSIKTTLPLENEVFLLSLDHEAFSSFHWQLLQCHAILYSL